MMDMRRSPPREGTRGGLELFKWDDIKSQGYKDRECYLGQSLKVGMTMHGGKFYKHDWWSKSKKSEKTELKEELAVTRSYEEELMKEALGLKPQRLLTQKTDLTVKQKKRLLEESKNFANCEFSSSELQNELVCRDKEKRKKENKRSKKKKRYNRRSLLSERDHQSGRFFSYFSPDERRYRDHQRSLTKS